MFRSVFQTDVSQATPRSTPLPPFSQAGESFGGPHASLGPVTGHGASGGGGGGNKSSSSNSIGSSSFTHQTSDQVIWDRAWYAVTSRIQLPSSVAVEDSFGTLAPESQDLDANFYDSLSLVLHPSQALPHASHTGDILLWHTKQVRQHFVHHVLPLLAACASQGGQAQILLGSIQTLEAAHRQYLYGLSLITRGMEEDEPAQAAVAKFQRDLHAMIGNSLTQGFLNALRGVLRDHVGTILGSGQRREGSDVQPADDRQIATAREELMNLLESLRKVGLAGEKFQVLFAEVLDGSMDSFIQDSYAGVWTRSEQSTTTTSTSVSSGCIAHLCHWVENRYARLAVEVLTCLDVKIAWNDVERWKDIAVGRLATLRMRELFDIALHWPESKGGLDDLRLAVTTPQRRLQLTDTFAATLRRRLLHSGRSTLYILRTYISMIKTFHALDHSKVLLDRVVQSLQLYLCQRDDAIRIVVTGLLSNPSSATPEDAKTKLIELANLLNTASQQQRRLNEDEELDWNDMTWVPDPVDAGVNYKRPKNEDVVGTLINALGSQDIFIKEFQLIISERLLSHQTTFVQETKVLGLLKKRFGEGALQNCDVMMKDIQDSKRVDALLCKNLRHDTSAEADKLAYHAKILSRLFWPSLPKDPFTVPPPVAAIQSQYEQGFEQLKSSRKLTWLDHIGTATVKLEFEDRTVELECKTYEAAVIYAFHKESGETDASPEGRAFDDLWAQLRIDEDLLEAALKFWVNKKVLRDAGDRTYVVIERLDEGHGDDQSEDAADETDAPDARQPSPRKPKMDSKEKERRVVYWQFIVGMLTNSAPAMPLGQIAMMMKMLIADGCSWSNEELQEFLGEKIAENELELVGGKYRLPKK